MNFCVAKSKGQIISSNFLFLLSFCYILLAHHLLTEWLIPESIKALKIKTSIVFKLDFPKNNFLSCFFFVFLNYCEFYFLIPAVIANIFNPITELVIPIETPIKE